MSKKSGILVYLKLANDSKISETSFLKFDSKII